MIERVRGEDSNDRSSQSRRHRGARHRQGSGRSIATPWAQTCPPRWRSPITASLPCSSRCPIPRSNCWSRSATTRRSPNSSRSNPDGGIHHVCYEVPDIRAARDTLEGARRARARRRRAEDRRSRQAGVVPAPEGFLRHVGRTRAGVMSPWKSAPPSQSISSSGGWCCSRCCLGACTVSTRAARSRPAPIRARRQRIASGRS